MFVLDLLFFLAPILLLYLEAFLEVSYEFGVVYWFGINVLLRLFVGLLAQCLSIVHPLSSGMTMML